MHLTLYKCVVDVAASHVLNFSSACVAFYYHTRVYNSCISPLLNYILIALPQACVLACHCLLQAGKLEDCNVLLEEVMGSGEEALETAKSTALYAARPSGSGRHEC